MDEDGMGGALVRALRTHDVDVITALEAGMLGRDDASHVTFASTQARVLFTYNAQDYYRLHTEHLAAGQTHGGIILAPQQRYSIGEVVRRLVRLTAARTPAQMANHVEFLSAW